MHLSSQPSSYVQLFQVKGVFGSTLMFELLTVHEDWLSCITEYQGITTIYLDTSETLSL